MQSLNSPLPFPDRSPDGYHYHGEPVKFDPDRHLQLEPPESVLRLGDLGYGPDQIKNCSTDFAVSSAVRLLSNEGVEVMLDVARSLRKYAVNCERIENMVRGGTYQSEFLRDFCMSREVTEFLSEIFETPVAPHTMPLHLGHLNFAPDDLDRAVDKWHYDTLGLDYVLMLSDPTELQGGDFHRLLDEVFKDLLWRCKIESHSFLKDSDAVFMPRLPELISLAILSRRNTQESVSVIVYPDPPISREEESLFAAIAPHVRLRSMLEWTVERAL